MFFLASVVLPQVIFISAMSFNCKKKTCFQTRSLRSPCGTSRSWLPSPTREKFCKSPPVQTKKRKLCSKDNRYLKRFSCQTTLAQDCTEEKLYSVHVLPPSLDGCTDPKNIVLFIRDQCTIYTVKSHTHLMVCLQKKSILLDPGFGSGGHWPPFCQLNSSRWFKGHFAHVWRYHNVSSVVVTRDDEVIYSTFCPRSRGLQSGSLPSQADLGLIPAFLVVVGNKVVGKPKNLPL